MDVHLEIMAFARRMTDWCSRVFRWKNRGNETAVPIVTEEEHITRALRRFEPHVIKLQRVLIWEDPLLSVLCVLAVNILFW